MVSSFIPSVFNYSTRYTAVNAVSSKGTPDYRACTDNDIILYYRSGQNSTISSDKNVITDTDIAAPFLLCDFFTPSVMVRITN
jgi:hypothetical protein